MKILVRSAHATVIISFFCAFSDFSKMDSNQIIKAIHVANVFTFWITLNCFYIGHCVINVFRLGSYFFNIIEKKQFEKILRRERKPRPTRLPYKSVRMASYVVCETGLGFPPLNSLCSQRKTWLMMW